MRLVFRLARTENIANPNVTVRRPKPQPGAKLIFGIALRYQQRRIRYNLRERPVKFFKQLRLEALGERLLGFQNQLLARFAAFGLGAGLHRFVRQHRAAGLQNIAVPQNHSPR